MILLVTCASQDELARDFLIGIGFVGVALLVAIVVLLVLMMRAQ